MSLRTIHGLACAIALALLPTACGFKPSGNGATDSGSGTPTADAPRTADDAPLAIDAPHIGAIDASTGSDAGSNSGSDVFTDCEAAFAAGQTQSGVQTIKPDSGSAFSAYCDMTTGGGGWTLVWVYGFTDYANFSRGDNAVTPRPTWNSPASTAGTPSPTSIVVPTGPTTRGALSFARWASLGKQFLVISNINQIVSCAPSGTNGGSLVDFTDGPIACTLITAVDTDSECTTDVPTEFMTSDPHGVGLYRGTALLDTYYFWEAITDTPTRMNPGNWPTHDPCGNNEADQLRGVASPYGSIYIKR